MVREKISNGVVHKLPEDLRKKLISFPIVLEKWNDLTPLGRNEYICWIEDAKKEKTRNNRVERTITELMEGKRRPCCWPGCSHRKKQEKSSM